MTTREILPRIEGIKQTGAKQWMGKCPCHNDRKASLSIAEGDDGRTLFKCQAGCATESIVDRIGLKMKDLHPEDKKPEPKQKYSPIVAAYPYHDAEGNFLYEKVRRADKSFTQRRKDGSGGYIYNRQGVPHVLYRLPEVIKAESWVFISEGEKDADNLVKAGFTATTGENGAGPGKWLPEYTEQLRWKHCVVIGDRDAVGQAYAVETANALHGAAASVKLLDLTKIWPEIPEHGDVSDMFQAKGEDDALSLLLDLLHETPEWEPSMSPTSTEQPRKDAGTIYPKEQISIDVVKTALRDLGIIIRNNQLLKEVEIVGLPKCYSTGNSVNVLPAYLIDYLKIREVKGVNPQAVDMYLSCIADENRFNPIKELLSSTEWDGVDRLGQIYSILGITEAKYQTYIRKWLIQCIALGLNDEEYPIGAEGVLVLQGEQGLAKTSFFKALAPNPRWFCEGALIDVGEKDTLLKALGAWITELGELDSTLKREQSALKAFITSPEDRIRSPYARNATRTPRRTSFCGTVNPADYLRDETGSRRFRTIPLTSIDKKTLFSLPRTWPIQLWAQVYKLYQENTNAFRLTDTEMKQLQVDNCAFSVPLPYETEIRELLNYSLPLDRWRWCRTKEVREYLPSNTDARRVGNALKKIVDEQATSIHLNPLKNPRMKEGNAEYFIPLKQYNQPSAWKSGTEVG